MAEEIFKDFFEESLHQIKQEYLESGRETEFKLWFNIQYVEDSTDSITVSVPSEFYWVQIQKKGIVEKIQDYLASLLGQPLTLKHITAKKEEKQPIVSEKSSIIMSDFSEKNNNQSVVEEETPKITEKSGTPQPAQNKVFSAFTQLIEEQKALEDSIPPSELQSKTPTPPSMGQLQKRQHPLLDENFTFDNFVPGDNSKYAFEATLAASKNPGKSYNPILIYGGSGLGKTHLMEAMGNYIYAQTPEKKISYISSESLMNEFTAAIREKSMDKFTKKYRNLDVFLLDDIQFLERSEKLQDEVFFIFNAIYKRKGQLVFTCDRPLSEIKGLNERLSSRFGSGLKIDIKIPDYETRRAILEKKLSVINKVIPEDVIDYIAMNIQTNVRELESCLKNCLGYAEFVGKSLTLDIVKEQLQDSIKVPSGIITIETIQNIVADHYQISVADLKGNKKIKKIVVPRQIAMYICKHVTEYSLQDIGDEFGGKDHSTVIHSIGKIENLLKIDANLAATIKLLEQTISKS